MTVSSLELKAECSHVQEKLRFKDMTLCTWLQIICTFIR